LLVASLLLHHHPNPIINPRTEPHIIIIIINPYYTV